jgi:hypothetical protein
MQKSSTQKVIRFDDSTDLAAHIKRNNIEYHDDNASWFGNITHSQALTMATKGDDSQVAAAEALMEKFSAEIETSQYSDEPSVAGCYACVPEALMGEPECMRVPELVGSESAPLSIYVDITSSATISADQIRKRGVAVLAAVMALSATRPISLHVITVMGGGKANSDGDEFNIVDVTIPTAPLDLATAAFALCHVGFARRLFYAVAMKEFKFDGSWPSFKGVPYADSRCEAYGAKVRKYLEIDGDVLLIPPANAAEPEIYTVPETWVRKQLEKFGSRAE